MRNVLSIVFCALVITACGKSVAVQKDEAMKSTLEKYRDYVDCGIVWEKKLSRSKEQPPVIAEAVASKCTSQLSIYKNSFQHYMLVSLGAVPEALIISQDSANQHASEAERELKKKVIGNIVEKRLQ
jgi:hypothetical protein